MEPIIRYHRISSGTIITESGGFKSVFEPKGMVVEMEDHEGRFLAGWSLCGKKDKFDRNIGRSIAFGRALVGTNKMIPEEMKYVFENVRVLIEKKFGKKVYILNREGIQWET